LKEKCCSNNNNNYFWFFGSSLRNNYLNIFLFTWSILVGVVFEAQRWKNVAGQLSVGYFRTAPGENVLIFFSQFVLSDITCLCSFCDPEKCGNWELRASSWVILSRYDVHDASEESIELDERTFCWGVM
jgi:hypothetical protein